MSSTVESLDTEIRDLNIQLAGKQMERAMAIGNRILAEDFKQLMYALIEERKAIAMVKAEKAGECFFVAAGEADAIAIEARGA